MSSPNPTRLEFELWAGDIARRPQDPAFAIVRATIEQTRALWALVDVLTGQAQKHEASEQTRMNFYHSLNGEPNDTHI